jgi:hypothetical protein
MKSGKEEFIVFRHNAKIPYVELLPFKSMYKVGGDGSGGITSDDAV